MGAMGQAGGGPGDTGGTPCSSCGVSCRWHSSLRASCPKELCAKGFSSRGQTAAKGFYVGNELLEAGGVLWGWTGCYRNPISNSTERP